MIWIAIYLLSAALDWWTSTRIIKRQPTWTEDGQIKRLLVGKRPSVKRFTLSAIAITATTIAVVVYFNIEWLVMFMAVPWHLYGAVSNYRLERKHR